MSKIRNAAVAVLATGAVALGGVAVAPSADAAPTPGCVDRAEFSKVRKGMTVDQVKRKFHGLNGRTTYRSTYSLSKTYKTCGSRWGSVTVDWDRYDTRDLRVGYKSAFWG